MTSLFPYHHIPDTPKSREMPVTANWFISVVLGVYSAPPLQTHQTIVLDAKNLTRRPQSRTQLRSLGYRGWGRDKEPKAKGKHRIYRDSIWTDIFWLVRYPWTPNDQFGGLIDLYKANCSYETHPRISGSSLWI